MRKFIFLLVLLKCWLTYVSSAADDLKVCLKGLGCVQGIHRPGFQTEKYEAFMGIPFAKPPVGDLRFRNPEAVLPWTDTLQTTAPKMHCVQKNYLAPNWPISGEEDCLYLNLYRPVQRTRKLPIMFYIHGGGFFSGTTHPGIIGPEYFMDSGEVILVVAAYRLGPFGFMSTGTADMPGNLGLKDQNLALKWVHDHVAAFGGNPEAVTIFGHSAGGSAVHYHMLSAASKGLFQRAILMSGTAYAPFGKVLSDPKTQAIQMAQAAGVKNANALSAEELGKALRGMDTTTLLNAGSSLKFWHLFTLSNFRPIVEDASWPQAFLTASPEKLMKNSMTVPWMMGLAPIKGEGAVLTVGFVENDKLRQEFNQQFDQLLWQMLELPANEQNNTHYRAGFEQLLGAYMGGKHELNDATTEGLMELIGDVNFYNPFYKTLEDFLAGAKTSKANLFEFNYRGPYTFAVVFGAGGGGSKRDYGVVHLDDMLYLFRTPLIFGEGYAKTSVDAAVVKKYVGLYVEFAKFGKVKSFEKLGACDLKKACNILKIVKDGDNFKEIVGNDINEKHMRLWKNIA